MRVLDLTSRKTAGEQERQGVLAFRAIALVAGSFVLARLVVRAANLPEEAYHSPVIAIEIVRRSGLAVFGLGFVWVILVARDVKRGPRWSAWADGRRLQAVAGTAALVSAWAYSTYAVNPVASQVHLADRVLLVALGVAAVWRPLFVLPFTVLLSAILGQFSAPLDGHSLSEPSLLVSVLVALAAAWGLRALAGGSWSRALVLVWLALVASHYFVSGVGKLQIDWIDIETVHPVLATTHANGWLGFLERETIDSFLRALERVDPLLVTGTILVECAGIAILVRPWLPAVLLVAWIGFHVGVFAMAGICFWKWIALDLAILAFIARPARIRELALDRWTVALLAGLLVAGSVLWFRPTPLVWYDTRVAYTYGVSVETENGVRREVGPSFFAPFDYQFTLGTFPYLARDPNLGLVWGATKDPEIARALRDVRSPAEVFDVESKLGRERHDTALTQRFERFLESFFAGKNEELRSKSALPHVLSIIAAPPQLWTTTPANGYAGTEPVRRVFVERRTSLWDGETFRIIRRTPLVELEISTPIRP